VQVNFFAAPVNTNSFPLGKLEETTRMPRSTWMKTTQQDLKSMNLSLNEAVDVAQNLPLWRLMEIDVYIWRYALIVVHARMNECKYYI